MAEHDRKPWAGGGNLGHAVLPIVLAGTAHHEEIALTEVPCPRPPATKGAHLEGARLTGADDRHRRILEPMTLSIRVPGNRVATVAIQVEPDRVERSGIVVRECSTGLGQYRQRLGVWQQGRPPGSQSRLGKATVVHGDLALGPRQ